MLPRSWMNSGNSQSSSGPSQSDYEERNRVSSFRGYLYKLRRSQNLLAPQWGKRWFSIEGHFLKWYRHEQDLCSSGMVDLKYIRSIHKLESTAYGNYTFLINCEERNLILRCTTFVEMNQWVRALHIQADIARGGTGMNVVSDFNQMPLNYSQMKSRKPGKLRTSMSLEQELDFHLKKLNELEQALLVSPSDSSSKNGKKKMKKKKQYDDGEDHDDLDDEASSMQEDDDEEDEKTKRRHSNRRQQQQQADFEEVEDSMSSVNLNNNRSGSRPGKSSSNIATATSSSSSAAAASSSGNHVNKSNERKKDVYRTESSESMEDSYEDSLPVRAPTKRGEDTRTSTSTASRTMERMESIEDISLTNAKVSRTKQYLKEQQAQHNRPHGFKGPGNDSDFDSPIKQTSMEDHEDEFDFEEIIPVGSKSSSSASATALGLHPVVITNKTNTNIIKENNDNNNNNRKSWERIQRQRDEKDDSLRSSRSRPTKSAWD